MTVGFDASGKSKTRKPFASRYSVIPSTLVTRSGALKGVDFAGAAFFGEGTAAAIADADGASNAAAMKARGMSRLHFKFSLLGLCIQVVGPGQIRQVRFGRFIFQINAVQAHLRMIISAAFSAIMITGAFVLPPTMRGMIDASTTRRRSIPSTRKLASTTSVEELPIRHVPTGW